ncbi:pilus assembly protein PilW [Xanthomonas sp. Kuri4-1]
MKRRPHPRHVQGLSLIELMIAMLIGLVLMLGVIQIFSASRAAYQLSEGMARTQENARFAMDYLQRDLRMGGHFGCVNDQSHLRTSGELLTHFSSTHSALNFPVSIQAYDATGTAPRGQVKLGEAASGWSPALPTEIAALQPAPLAGSDVLVLRFLASEGAPVQSIATTGSATTFTVPTARWRAFTQNGVTAPATFGIADCSYVDLFNASATSASAGTVKTDVVIDRYTAQPSGQTMLYRAESLVYYVATGAGGTEPSLYRVRFSGSAYQAPEELVEGVESLQLLFGQDRETNLASNPPTGYIDVYNTAATIGTVADAWRRVGSVQVGLLMRSPDRAAAEVPSADNRPYALGVEFVPPATSDGKYRASYETTVALRNRLYGN